MTELYTKAEIEHKLKIARGRLQEWINAGYIEPYESATQGRAAKFNQQNLYQIYLFSYLLKYGAPRHVAADYIDAIDRHKYLLVTEIEGSPHIQAQGWESIAGDKLPAIHHRHKIYCVINLEILKREIDTMLG